jgi:hypothetical protein
MFNFFAKKKISVEDMASGMYMLFIRDAVKESQKDIDGNIILDTNEQKLLLLSHLCELLDSRDMANVKLQLLAIFTRDNRKVRSELDLIVEMLVVTDSVKKIQNFFVQIPKESHEFFRGDFLFGKKLNPMQKTLALSWHVEHAKAIDSVFKSAIDKFRLMANGEAFN